MSPSGFPAEPVNTITSFAPVLLGLLALWWLYRGGQRDWVAYLLAVLTVLTGLGSVAWHGMRTELTLTLDWVPGVIYFVVFAIFWVLRVSGLYVAVAGAAVVVALVFLLPPVGRFTAQALIVGGVVTAALALLAATWARRRPAFGIAAATVGFAGIALAARSLDRGTCDAIPVGTHFLWHIFLGLAAYCGVRAMARLEAARSATGS